MGGYLSKLRQRSKKKVLRQERAQLISKEMEDSIKNFHKKWKSNQAGRTALELIPQDKKRFYSRPVMKGGELNVKKTLKKMDKRLFFGRNFGGEYIENIGRKISYLEEMRSEALKRNNSRLAEELKSEINRMEQHKAAGADSLIIKTKISPKDVRKLSSDKVFNKMLLSDVSVAVHEAGHGLIWKKVKNPAQTITKEGMRTHEGLATYIQIKETERISRMPFDKALLKAEKRLPNKEYSNGARMWKEVIDRVSSEKSISEKKAIDVILERMNKGKEVTIDKIHSEIVGRNFRPPKRRIFRLFG